VGEKQDASGVLGLARGGICGWRSSVGRGCVCAKCPVSFGGVDFELDLVTPYLY